MYHCPDSTRIALNQHQAQLYNLRRSLVHNADVNLCISLSVVAPVLSAAALCLQAPQPLRQLSWRAPLHTVKSINLAPRHHEHDAESSRRNVKEAARRGTSTRSVVQQDTWCALPASGGAGFWLPPVCWLGLALSIYPSKYRIGYSCMGLLLLKLGYRSDTSTPRACLRHERTAMNHRSHRARIDPQHQVHI